MSRFNTLIYKIDAVNSSDPNRIQYAGSEIAKELLYSMRMTDELAAFRPEASEQLQIAARAQHIERWTSPRAAYPEGRTGYKKWRAQLMLFHTNRTGELMAEAGYPEDDIKRVKYLIQKRAMSKDEETQALEDVICLVFIKHYLQEFASEHPREKIVDIIQKTWKKMSSKAQAKALTINLAEDVSQLVQDALSNTNKNI